MNHCLTHTGKRRLSAAESEIPTKIFQATRTCSNNKSVLHLQLVSANSFMLCMKTRRVVIRVFCEAGCICQHQVWSDLEGFWFPWTQPGMWKYINTWLLRVNGVQDMVRGQDAPHRQILKTSYEIRHIFPRYLTFDFRESNFMQSPKIHFKLHYLLFCL